MFAEKMTAAVDELIASGIPVVVDRAQMGKVFVRPSSILPGRYIQLEVAIFAPASEDIETGTQYAWLMDMVESVYGTCSAAGFYDPDNKYPGSAYLHVPTADEVGGGLPATPCMEMGIVIPFD